MDNFGLEPQGGANPILVTQMTAIGAGEAHGLQRGIWSFEAERGFAPYDSSINNSIEESYKRYLEHPTASNAITPVFYHEGICYRVDFRTMRQIRNDGTILLLIIYFLFPNALPFISGTISTATAIRRETDFATWLENSTKR